MLLFERFFKDNYARSYRYAISLVGDGEAARDIVADSFEHLMRHFSTQQPPPTDTDLRNLLLTMVRNKSADHYRRLNVRDRYAQHVVASAERADTVDAGEHEAQVDAIYRAMDLLTPKTRAIVEAHYLQHKKYGEVAREMGISESAVKKHVMQALSVFRERLKQKDC